MTLFLSVCIGLEWAGRVRNSLLWPFGLLAFAPWSWWMWIAGASGLTRTRSLVAFLIPLGVFRLLIVVLTEPRAARTTDDLAVVFAIDISGSVTPEGSSRPGST